MASTPNFQLPKLLPSASISLISFKPLQNSGKYSKWFQFIGTPGYHICRLQPNVTDMVVSLAPFFEEDTDSENLMQGFLLYCAQKEAIWDLVKGGSYDSAFLTISHVFTDFFTVLWIYRLEKRRKRQMDGFSNRSHLDSSINISGMLRNIPVGLPRSQWQRTSERNRLSR